jgi:hypothetical protein
MDGILSGRMPWMSSEDVRYTMIVELRNRANESSILYYQGHDDDTLA